MENIYREKQTVPCYMTDVHGRLNPAGFMNFAQEAANRAAEMMGFGYDVLHKNDMAWVLSRYHIKFLQPVRWKDEIEISTWHKGLVGPFCVRDFDVRNSAGEQVIIATSSWIVFNTRTRAFVREGFREVVPEWSERHEDVMEQAAGKSVPPRGVEPVSVGSHTVSYADVDILGHTNNVRYMVWAMDAISQVSFDKPCKELFINYNRECSVGETVELFRMDDGDNVFIEGKVDGTQSFICKLVF